MVVLHGMLYVACEFLDAQVADRDSEVISCDVFQFVRFVKDNRSGFWEDPRIRRALGLQLDSKVRKKQVMVDDNDVALHRPAAHFGHEAALPLAALLASAGIGAGVELVPKQASLRQFGQLGTVAGGGGLLP